MRKKWCGGHPEIGLYYVEGGGRNGGERGGRGDGRIWREKEWNLDVEREGLEEEIGRRDGNVNLYMLQAFDPLRDN